MGEGKSFLQKTRNNTEKYLTQINMPIAHTSMQLGEELKKVCYVVWKSVYTLLVFKCIKTSGYINE